MRRLTLPAGLAKDETRLLILLGSGSFLLMSSLSSINVALPAIQRDFDISLSALKCPGGATTASVALDPVETLARPDSWRASGRAPTVLGESSTQVPELLLDAAANLHRIGLGCRSQPSQLLR